MTISELCKRIELQPEAAKPALSFAENFDFTAVDPYLKAFRDYKKVDAAEAALQKALGEDADHSKILACQLKAAADTRELYREKGISDEIYFATMRCFTRFTQERHVMTGEYKFDREFWAPRQAGGLIYRIAALEYELVPAEDDRHINVHIPSDADLSPASCTESLRKAKEFFAGCYPAFTGCPYRCYSWLLSPDLEELLPKRSNIRSFRERFEILGSEASNDYLEWLFYNLAGREKGPLKDFDYQSLPEDSSLQRAVKQKVLEGGQIRDGLGRLI